MTETSEQAPDTLKMGRDWSVKPDHTRVCIGEDIVDRRSTRRRSAPDRKTASERLSFGDELVVRHGAPPRS